MTDFLPSLKMLNWGRDPERENYNFFDGKLKLSVEPEPFSSKPADLFPPLFFDPLDTTHRFSSTAAKYLSLRSSGNVDSTVTAPPINLKVITANAYLFHSESGIVNFFFNTPNAEKRVVQLTDWIRAQKADIVFLQEVWQKPLFNKIASRAGFPYTYHFSNVGGGNNDLAILSRYPLSNPRFEATQWQGSETDDCGKDLGGNFRTGLATITANIKGKEVLLANVHPMHRRPDEDNFDEPISEFTPERVIQIVEISQLLKSQMKGQPVIFGGDFNFHTGQREDEVFRRLFKMGDSSDILAKKYGSKACTYCEDNPINQENEAPGEGVLDHVFVNDEIELVDATIAYPVPNFSDHQPLVTLLRLAPPVTGPAPTSTNPVNYVPLTSHEIAGLLSYLGDVSFSFPACFFSQLGGANVRGATAFLRNLQPEPTPRPEPQPTQEETLLSQLSQ